MFSPEPDLISEVTIEEIKIEPEDEELDDDAADASEQIASEPPVESAEVTKCEKCNRFFDSNQGIKTHVIHCKGLDPDGKTSWLHNCEICSASFKFRSSLVAHLKKHGGIKAFKCRVQCDKPKYPCEVCGKEFKEARFLQRHRGLHMEEKPFRCKLCGAGLSSQVTLNNHMKITHGKATLQCLTCGSEFKSSSTFYKHRRMVHNEVFTKEKMLRERSVSDIRTEVGQEAYTDSTELLLVVAECETCHRFFESKEGMVSHELSCNELNEAPDLLYTCHICTVSFKTLILLSAHLKEHKDGKLLKCRVVCDNWFYDSQKRDDHEKVCRPDKNSCLVCYSKLANKKSLWRHMNTVHAEAKHECKTCGKKFKTRSDMNVHQRTLHSENPPKFTCEICERVFTQARKLRKHMEKHVKPEPC